jgi:hypothetical protein
MSFTSTIRTAESAPAIAVVNEGESLPAAAPKSNVTVIDARTGPFATAKADCLRFAA